MQKYLDKLGLPAKDKVTGFEGTITSVSFDLYGCVQFILTPKVKAATEKEDSYGRWFDEKRVVPTSAKRVMELPTYAAPPGPERKPPMRSGPTR